MRVDIMVVRDASSGVPGVHRAHVEDHVSILNAGEADVSHPTQGLLDLLTIRLHKNDFEVLKVRSSATFVIHASRARPHRA